MFKVHCVLQVICCEGNAGFYEVGCMNTPLDGEDLSTQFHSNKKKKRHKQFNDTFLPLPTTFSGGYSVLGWNHPGFAGSTVSISNHRLRLSALALMWNLSFRCFNDSYLTVIRGLKQQRICNTFTLNVSIFLRLFSGCAVSSERGERDGCSDPVCCAQTGVPVERHCFVCLVNRGLYR